MKFFRDVQTALEAHYGAATGLDVSDFVRSVKGLDNPGQMIVQQIPESTDLDLALLFDRDFLSAWGAAEAVKQPSGDALSVVFEEISHFVYLSFNHARGRNVTRLELEIQSEVDRIWLAYHGGLGVGMAGAEHLRSALFGRAYDTAAYEESRLIARRFLSGGERAPDPAAWTNDDFRRQRDFFHSDLARKLFLAGDGKRG